MLNPLFLTSPEVRERKGKLGRVVPQQEKVVFMNCKQIKMPIYFVSYL